MVDNGLSLDRGVFASSAIWFGRVVQHGDASNLALACVLLSVSDVPQINSTRPCAGLADRRRTRGSFVAGGSVGGRREPGPQPANVVAFACRNNGGRVSHDRVCERKAVYSRGAGGDTLRKYDQPKRRRTESMFLRVNPATGVHVRNRKRSGRGRHDELHCHATDDCTFMDHVGHARKALSTVTSTSASIDATSTRLSIELDSLTFRASWRKSAAQRSQFPRSGTDLSLKPHIVELIAVVTYRVEVEEGPSPVSPGLSLPA